MRFLFVDKIHRIEGDEITGAKTFAESAPMRYDNGEIAPSVISEAIGQLVSWLCIKENGFTARPVFLFADQIEMLATVAAGKTVDLTARVDSRNAEDKTFVFSGEAYVDGKLVQRIRACNGYFMPLGELEDPEVTKSRFAALIGDGLHLDGDEGRFDFESLVDDIVERHDGATTDIASPSILARKTMKADERFYLDHFPRMPVTPIVMINEMIGQAAAALLCPEGRGRLRIRAVDAIKIRSFVRPGDTVDVRVAITSEEAGLVHTTAELIKGRKPILRGRYTYFLAATKEDQSDAHADADGRTDRAPQDTPGPRAET